MEEMAVNPLQIMKLKTQLNDFRKRHPGFTRFIMAIRRKGLPEGSVLDVKITTPDGETMTTNFRVEAEDIEFVSMLTPMEEVVNHALNNNVQVVSAELNTSYSKLNYQRAKGYYFPSLYLYGGYNTSYFVNMENQAAYDSFLNQFKNNMGSYIQVGLSIPIFSGLERRTSAQVARNAWRNAELDQIAVRNAVESEVTQSYQQMQGYAKQYVLGQKKLEAAQLAYDGIAAKFEKGLVTAIDLQTASTTLLQAKSDCLRSRLQYVIEYRMVEYYNGKDFLKTENLRN